MAKACAALLVSAQACLDSDTSVLDSQLLLAKVLNKGRTWLIAHDDEELKQEELGQYRELVNQCASGHPMAYLLGQQEFWSMNLKVSPDTLIPRPDTECLVEAVLKLMPKHPMSILDLGTGSGAIALAIAKERPNATVFALDKSKAAITVAEENRFNHQLGNAHFLVGSWVDAIAAASVDLVVSNPPYIASADEHLQQLKFEPLEALTSGSDGLDDIRAIAQEAKRCLKPGGHLAMEHGYDQQSDVIKILSRNEFCQVEGHQDLQLNPRFVIAKLP